MKTHLVLYFSSEGADPREIGKKIASAGFKAMVGQRDFVFVWDKKPSTDDLLDLGDKVRNALKGTHTVFKLETAD